MKRAATAIVALAVAGCGGGPSDKEKVETTIRDYFTAFADSDFGKACGELADETRAELTKAARAKDCSAALARGAQQADVKRFATKLRDVRIVSVDVEDHTATAKVRAIGATTTLPLTKEGDEWKVRAAVGEEGE